MAYLYPISLAAISLLVLTLEALFPARPQKILRKRLWSDALHLIFNGHFLGVMVYGIATYHLIPHLDALLTAGGVKDAVYMGAAGHWPIAVQIIVALLVMDLMQWGIHNLLHRVPFLWDFHKTHHSVKDGEMDWIVSFRFQWTEVVLYKTLQYLPLAFFDFGYEAVMVHAIFGTLIGHLNHANVRFDYGPLKYVLNSPKMHLWHHNYHAGARSTVNFGIIFSVWDWIFGTARLPDHPPEKIGFDGVETFPDDFFGQSVWPLQAILPRPDSLAMRLVAGGVAVGVFGLAWWLHLP